MYIDQNSYIQKKITHRPGLLSSWRLSHLTEIPALELVNYSIFKDQQRSPPIE